MKFFDWQTENTVPGCPTVHVTISDVKHLQSQYWPLRNPTYSWSLLLLLLTYTYVKSFFKEKPWIYFFSFIWF